MVSESTLRRIERFEEGMKLLDKVAKQDLRSIPKV
jgi:hypothetical protein